MLSKLEFHFSYLDNMKLLSNSAEGHGQTAALAYSGTHGGTYGGTYGGHKGGARESRKKCIRKHTGNARCLELKHGGTHRKYTNV